MNINKKNFELCKLLKRTGYPQPTDKLETGQKWFWDNIEWLEPTLITIVHPYHMWVGNYEDLNDTDTLRFSHLYYFPTIEELLNNISEKVEIIKSDNDQYQIRKLHSNLSSDPIEGSDLFEVLVKYMITTQIFPHNDVK